VCNRNGFPMYSAGAQRAIGLNGDSRGRRRARLLFVARRIKRTLELLNWVLIVVILSSLLAWTCSSCHQTDRGTRLSVDPRPAA
jgi:hypothetical protein